MEFGKLRCELVSLKNKLIFKATNMQINFILFMN